MKRGGEYRYILDDGILQFGDGLQFSAVFVFVPKGIEGIYFSSEVDGERYEGEKERDLKNKNKIRLVSPRLASPPPETCSLASVAQSCF